MLFVIATTPPEGTRTSLDLVRQIGSRDELPDIRVGLATGSVISRLGDVFGPPVNLAARLSHVARSNRVLIDEVTARVPRRRVRHCVRSRRGRCAGSATSRRSR